MSARTICHHRVVKAGVCQNCEEWVGANEAMMEEDRYKRLRKVFDDVFLQVSKGKGEERHASKKPIEEQLGCVITREIGLGFPLGQAIKKVFESCRMDKKAAIKELHGVIAYLAMAVIVLEDENGSD